jgi:hypothetical protein
MKADIGHAFRASSLSAVVNKLDGKLARFANCLTCARPHPCLRALMS